MKVNGFYFFVAFLGVALVWVTLGYFRSTANGVPGVTQSKDLIVRTAFQAEIKEVRVRPGQEVKAGDTLLIMASPGLDQDQARIQRKLLSLETEQHARQSAFRSSLALAGNDIALEVKQIEEAINQARHELELNLRLTDNKDLRSEDSPLAVRIRDMESQVTLFKEQLRQKEKELRAAHEADQAILQNQIDLTRIEMGTVNHARSSLVRTTDYDGVIEAVSVRPGVMVDAYAQLLSVRPASPSMVVAYVQSGEVPFGLGARVEMHAFGGQPGASSGKVIGFGSIVALPEILQKSTAVTAFGQEVYVEIPPGNPFTTGQKVLVKTAED